MIKKVEYKRCLLEPGCRAHSLLAVLFQTVPWKLVWMVAGAVRETVKTVLSLSMEKQFFPALLFLGSCRTGPLLLPERV